MKAAAAPALRRPLRTVGAVVLGTAVAVSAPIVFLFLAVVGLQPFREKDELAWVIVLLLSFMIGTAVFLGAGALTYRLTGRRWLIASPYVVGLVLVLAVASR